MTHVKRDVDEFGEKVECSQKERTLRPKTCAKLLKSKVLIRDDDREFNLSLIKLNNY